MSPRDTLADLVVLLARAAEVAVALGLVPESVVLRLVLERLELFEARGDELVIVDERKSGGV